MIANIEDDDANVRGSREAVLKPARYVTIRVSAKVEDNEADVHSSREVVLKPARYVTIRVASSITGYSVRAINHKIDDGTWREGREWRKAPDGRRLVDIQGYERWVQGSR